MRHHRSAVLALALTTAVLWGLFAWLVAPRLAILRPPLPVYHKIAPVLLALAIGAAIWRDLAFGPPPAPRAPGR